MRGTKPPCTDPSGCTDPVHAKGLCSLHYERRRRARRHLLAAAQRYAVHVLEQRTSQQEIADLVAIRPNFLPQVERQVRILTEELRRSSANVPMSKPSPPPPSAPPLRFNASALLSPGRCPWEGKTKIEKLPLMTRTRNSLRRAGHVTVGDVAALEDADLRDIRSFGAVSIRDLRHALYPNGASD